MNSRLIKDHVKREVAQHVLNVLAGEFIISVNGVYTPVVSLQIPDKKLDTHLTVDTDQGLRHFNVHLFENFIDKGRIVREGRIL